MARPRCIRTRRLDGVAGATGSSRCPPGGDLPECESDDENLEVKLHPHSHGGRSTTAQMK
jgi:hypothetical protein